MIPCQTFSLFSCILFLTFTSSFSPLFGRNIAYFFALDADWKSFCEKMEATPSVRQSGGRTIFEINTGSDKILASKMEAGCVKSAVSAQAILTSWRIDMAYSVGPVGALSPDLKLGEWVVINKVVPWQKQSMQNMDPETSSCVESQFLSLSETTAALRQISVASGEQFISSQEIREEICRATECLSVDMNLFGLATALSVNGVPATHLRVVSDKANEQARGEFEHFINSYNGEGGRIVAAIIKSLPKDMTLPSEYPKLQHLLEVQVQE